MGTEFILISTLAAIAAGVLLRGDPYDEVGRNGQWWLEPPADQQG